MKTFAPPPDSPSLSPEELALFSSVLFHDVYTNGEISVESIERVSDARFDIRFSGKIKFKSSSHDFSAWLPLMSIRFLVDWTTNDISNMTDYPDMARDGDWSAIRDTGKDRQWEIFRTCVEPAYAKIS